MIPETNNLVHLPGSTKRLWAQSHMEWFATANWDTPDGPHRAVSGLPCGETWEKMAGYRIDTVGPWEKTILRHQNQRERGNR